ncbi:substrate-binding domain-containing protein [Aidingimonas lacisalsi]|uniref:substrate-binding domain-containing protein n=1 Tax=Aidingimonas lacisalsi TaxID=2604086 RepID=UPI0011D19180|nr:substrate-binding domain-containing protein [Aidingimonas lacisalsi]
MGIRFATIAIGLASLISAGSVLAQDAESTFEGQDDYRFVIIPKAVAPWFDKVHEGADLAGEMIEAQTGAEVEIVYNAPSESKVAIQNQIIERAISTQPDGIAIDPLDGNANKAILQEALDQGIKVVIFDSFAPEGLEVSSVGNDFCEQAKTASRRLVELIDETGQVAIMMGTPSAPNHAIRVRCHEEVFSEYPDIEVVAKGINNDSIVEAQNQALTIMQANPELDGWVASEASGPIGIAQAITEAGLEDQVHLVGLEKLPEMLDLIENGRAEGSAANRPIDQGYWTVTTLWQQMLGVRTPVYMDTGVDLITDDNLDEFR